LVPVPGMAMIRPRTFFLLAFGCLLTALAWPQAPSGGQEFLYTISTSQPWTDTSLDLQSGDFVQITASRTGSSECDPRGVSGAVHGNGLPLASAPVGALIGRLHAHGASPFLIGSGTELRIEEPSHLFLGVNAAGDSPCAGNFAVTVHRVAGSSSNSEAGSSSRGDQLKSQLSTAAEIFMQGQFGADKAASGASGGSGEEHSEGTGSAGSGSEEATAPVLKLSNAALDPALRKNIDGLPRRVNDQLQNLGDMVNFVIVGSQKSVLAALDSANWHAADTTKKRAVLGAVLDTYEDKDYLQMPMSTLYLFGRAQDFGYEMAEPIAMVASRHHFRLWKAPFTLNGQEVWVGAGTHDIGFSKDKRNGSVTHKIDPLVDGERDNIGGSLQKAGKVESLTYYLPPYPVRGAKNATGDGYQSDGRVLVIILR
jgi:hypothetical protein